MRAIVYEEFNGPIGIRSVSKPSPGPGEVILKVEATGVCRSDWHGWQGHDSAITSLPHVPGHEMAGELSDIGDEVPDWSPGDRVVVPFVAGCGVCEMCLQGDPQVCPNQEQPGFTQWGSFAEYVKIPYANHNLVTLPSSIDFVTAVSLGCRFTTAYRAVVDRANVKRGEWLAVHGCGGVGLSAVMIGVSQGARVVAIDINPGALELAQSLGAEVTVDGSGDVSAEVQTATGGGAHVSIDAVGSAGVVLNSIGALRRRGRHVQVGLLTGTETPTQIPMDRVIAWELDLLGSHGAQASLFSHLFAMIDNSQLDPSRLVTRRLSLELGAAALEKFDSEPTPGIAVIEPWN